MTAEHDSLRAAFDELRTSSLPAVQPPGVAAAGHTARRRRAVRRGLTSAGALAAVAVIALWSAAPSPREQELPGGDPTADRTALAATASTQPSGSPSTTVRPALNSRHGAGSGSQSATDCVDFGYATPAPDSAFPYAHLTFSSDTGLSLCRDAQLKVFWASYHINPDGTATLYHSGTTYMKADILNVSFTVEAPANCVDWYIGSGDVAIPTLLPAGGVARPAQPGDPFWDSAHDESAVRWNDPSPDYAACTSASPTPSATGSSASPTPSGTASPGPTVSPTASPDPDPSPTA